MLPGTAFAVALLLVFACSNSSSDGAGKIQNELQVFDVERTLAAISALDPWEFSREILQGLSKEEKNQLAEALYELRMQEPAPLTLSEVVILGSSGGYAFTTVGVRPDGSLVTEDDWDDVERMMLWHNTPPERREELGLPDKVTDIYATYNLLAGQGENALEILAANEELAEAIRTYEGHLIEPTIWPSEKGVDSND